MSRLLHTELTSLLTRTGVRQASFARMLGVTPRQVNNWCRGRAAIPQWAALLAYLLECFEPAEMTEMLEQVDFTCWETLGVTQAADAPTIRQAVKSLALLYHPDTGGTHSQMVRVNEAHQLAREHLRMVGKGHASHES